MIQKFEKIGYNVYTYSLPSWQDCNGKVHHMDIQHTYSVSLDEARDLDMLRLNRVQTAMRYMLHRENMDKVKYVLIFHEDYWNTKPNADAIVILPEDHEKSGKIIFGDWCRFFIVEEKVWKSSVLLGLTETKNI